MYGRTVLGFPTLRSVELASLGGSRFEVTRQLGAGGMGVVYEAIDRETGERVALKTLQHLTAQSLYRFKNEFRALRGIYHRNLVRLGELHGQDEQWFFTMELVEGTNVLLHVRPRPVVPATGSRPDVAKATAPLEERAGHGPPAGFPHTDEADEGDDRTPPDGTPIDDATVVSPNRPSTGEARAAASSPGVEPDWERLGKDLQQIVDALVALHDAGKVHRDLKPSNVLVTEQGRVVLLDFGLVMDAYEDLAEGTDQNLAGTIGYMAPEQATLGGTGPAADYYALGVILYQMITGRMPFQGPPAEILAQKRLGPPPDPRVLCPNAPEELARLALDLLSPTPEARPSGEEVKRRLSRHQRRSSRPPSGYASGEFSAPTIGFCVGRGSELEILRASLDRALGGRSASVLVSGPAGIGKTFLVSTFLDEVRKERPEAIVLRSRARRDEVLPFQAIDGLVDATSHALLRLPEAKVARLLPARTRLLVDVFPVLRRVPAIEALSVDEIELPPNEIRIGAFRALRDLLHELARQWPVVVAVDDLHEADSDSVVEIANLLAGDKAPPFLFVATARPTGHADDHVFTRLGLPPSTRKLDLAPLSDEDARALVELLHPSVDEPSIDELVGGAGGHPLHLQEIVRHARSHPGRRGITLEEAIAERVSALEPETRTLLDCVALLDRPTPEAVLAAATSLELGQVRAVGMLLENARLVRTERADGRLTLEPLHDRVTRAALGKLEAGRITELCERLLGGLDREPDPARRDDLSVPLLEALGRHGEAAERLVAAAASAEARLAFDRAAALLLEALRVGEHGREQEKILRERAARCLHWSGSLPEAAEQLERAAQLTTDRLEKASLLVRAAESYATAYEAPRMERAAAAALPLLGRRYPDTPARKVLALLRSFAALAFLPIGSLLSRKGAERQTEWRLLHSLAMSMQIGSYVTTDLLLGAVATFDAILLGQKLGPSIERVRGLWMESIILLASGLRRASQKALASLDVMARSLGDHAAQGSACFGRTISLTKLDRFEAAEEAAEAGLVHAPWMGAFEYVGMTSRVGLVQMLTGHLTRSVTWTRRALDRARPDVDNRLLSVVRDTLAVQLAILGRPNDGEERFSKLLGEEVWTNGRVQVGLGMGLFHCYETGNDGPLVEALLRAHQTSAVSPSHVADEELVQYLMAAYIHARRALAGTTRSRGDLAGSLRPVRTIARWRMFRAHLPVLEAAALLVDGRPEKALARLEVAERLAREDDNPWATFEAIAMRVRAYVRLGYERDARLHLRMALALAEEQRWTRRDARLRAELGRLLDRD